MSRSICAKGWPRGSRRTGPCWW